MPRLLQIAQLGRAVLRETAEPVRDVHSADTAELVEDMLATMLDARPLAAGLAAPQVFQSLRIVVVRAFPTPNYPNAQVLDPTPLLNPVIEPLTDTMLTDWEGCASIPGLAGLVARYEHIRVAYTTLEGEQCERRFEGFLARLVQHECDHLDGILYLDRMESLRDLVTEAERQRIQAEMRAKTQA